MRNKELIDSFSEFKEFKHIDKATTMRVLEDVFRSMLRKKYGTDENFDIIINTEKGDLEIYRRREIIDDNSEDIWDADKIALADAQKIEPDFEIGEELTEIVNMELEFGRRAILSARQALVQRIMELEKDSLYKKYKDRVGELISGEIYQIWKKEISVLDDEDNELLLEKDDQIPNDVYKKGENIKAIIKKVDYNTTNNNLKIYISRTEPDFLARLIELEVPEIFDGLITIKKIVRQPGERAKIAVESYDDRIDPVGACVGMKGSRIQGIVRELRSESIDVINYTTNLNLFVARALSPAKITTINIDEEKRKVAVFVKPDQVPLAIGARGSNIKLAAKLVGYEIDVFRDTEEEFETDIEIDEFSDEFEPWIIEELKRIGLDTGRSVLEAGFDELLRRTSIEEETIKEILQTLTDEFED